MLRSLSLGTFRLDSNSVDLGSVAMEDSADMLDRRLSAGKPTGRKVLIVQGDWEAGMSRLALDLRDAGHEVGKVFFCAADIAYKFRGIRTHLYREPLAEFDAWLRELVRTEGYDTFFLYNHYRPYNQVAWDFAEEQDLGCWVFELGLIRPNCMTVFSRQTMPVAEIARKWDQMRAGGDPPPAVTAPPELCQVSTTAKMLTFCTSFLFSRITAPLFPNFVDQREMKLGRHFKHGLIHLWRFFERGRDCEFDAIFAGEWAGTYYAVPLQVHSDTQITRCSDFTSIEQFIKKVVRSFEYHAAPDARLVFKVHPMDRGYKDYTDLIAGLNHRLGGDRILYVDRVHLPTLLANSLGVVNINSSVGISGLVHHVPVLTLGTAVYDLEGLTFAGKLDDFWTQAEAPKPQRVKHFINLLLNTSQGRGTLSQRCFDVANRCKIQWPKPFQDEFFGHASAALDEFGDDTDLAS